MGADIEFYIKNDPQFRDFYRSKGLSKGQRMPRAEMQVLLDQYLTQRPVDDVAAATQMFEGLPETSMTQPQLPATAGAPPADFSGLVPERQGPLQDMEDAPLPPVEQAAQPQGFAADEALFRNVLRVRGLQLKELEPFTKNDDEMKIRSKELMESYLDDAPALQSFGIRDITTYNTVAQAPAEYQDKAWRMVKQQIERGEEPSWMSALETVKQQAVKTEAAEELTDVDRTAESLKRDTSILPEGDRSIKERQQRLSRLNQQELAREIARNPQEQRDIALAVQNSLTGDDLEGQDTFEVNLSKLEASQKEFRNNEDAQLAILRGILGEGAGDSTNVGELVATLNDDQARQFAAKKREAKIEDLKPGAVVIRPGVMTNAEIRRNIQNAVQSNALLLEINEDKKKGMTATSAYLTPQSFRATMERFKDPESESAPSPTRGTEGEQETSIDSPDVVKALEDRIAALDPESEEAKTLRTKLNEYRKGQQAREFLTTQVLPGMKEGLLKIVPPPSEWARAGGALLRGAKAIR